MNWYQASAKEVLHELESSESGLSDAEAKKRVQRYGQNKLVEEERTSRLNIILHQFTSPLIYILLIAGIVTIVLGEYIDSGVIFAIVILNAIVGFTQEYKAEESVRALKKLTVPKAKVLRDGREREINSEDLVPGDIVLIASGTRVPADLRLTHVIELKIDESMLTGESLPAEKTTAPIKEKHLTSGDQKNMAFLGTVTVSGRGKGIVVATGASTVLGGIAGKVKEVGIVKAPIQEKINSFASAVAYIVLGASIGLFAIGMVVGESLQDMFMTAVAAAVATIPEGLPIVVTIAMAIGVARMARHNAIIRKLPAVETLGSTTVICSDKTGTLTKNEMTVSLIHVGNSVYSVTGTGYKPEGEVFHNGVRADMDANRHLTEVLRIGLLCNESALYEEDGEWKIDGDPTEGALIVSAIKGGLKAEEERERHPRTAMIPFESERGYMATLHRHGRERILYVKGAPEKIIEMCSASLSGRLNKKEALHTAREFAREGLRVLAMAYKGMPQETEDLTHHDAETDLVFAGLQGMIDPARPEAIDAVEGCRRAGIRVVMITGDHAVTATAIARKMGIGGDDPRALEGKEIEALSDEKLFELVRHVSVYARVSPQHKLRITEQLKNHGEIVAMTGDGVNDAPALKSAHIGIAMGRSGTDVAKEASDMVLTDDNFASIFSAVREGRVVFDNLRKVVFFLIPTGVAAIFSIIGVVILKMPIPYVPAQLLWINLVTNGLQDVALAFEPGEKGVLSRPPRHPREPIMSRLLIERTVIVGLLISAGIIFNFISALNAGDSIGKARTVSVTTMVFFQFFQAWNSRSEIQSIFRIPLASNPFLLYSMIAAFLAQLAVIYVPALQWVFRTEPIDARDWLQIVAVSVTVILVVEIDKLWRRRGTEQEAA
ncbi:MAG: cation-transporting P-type ATPase [Thermodesulfovibrionales bacterium]